METQDIYHEAAKRHQERLDMLMPAILEQKTIVCKGTYFHTYVLSVSTQNSLGAQAFVTVTSCELMWWPEEVFSSFLGNIRLISVR